MGGSGKTSQASLETTSPWSVQQPFIEQAFQGAQGAYNNQSQAVPYSGDFFAQVTPQQREALGGLFNFGQNQGMGAANQQIQGGGSLLNQGVSNVGQASQGLFGMAGQDPTQANIQAAGQYADNPYISGQVDAAMRDSVRNYTEGVAPQLTRNESISGNLNSSRGGVARGIAERGLQDQAGDISSQLRGQAYQQGISQASADRGQNLQALQSAGTLGSQAAASGLSGLSAGVNTGIASGQAAQGAADAGQALNQQSIDNGLAKYEYSQQFPWQALNNYYGIVGDKSWGSSSTGFQKGKTAASPLSTAGTIVGTAAALFKSDRRSKEALVDLDLRSHGVPLYAYRYIGDPRTWIGPMAQDVAEVTPEAVVSVGGVLHIDIRRLH